MRGAAELNALPIAGYNPMNRLALWWLTALVLAVASLTLVPARAEDAPPPLLTPENAAQLVGKPAVVEFRVVEVKFAQRRKLYFLSGKSNFRSADNQAVAIRADDLPAFRIADVEQLRGQYLNQTIRARGQVQHDEGQYLLFVARPEDIELRAAIDATKVPKQLVVMDELGNRTTLPLPLPADLPRTQVTLNHNGQQEVFSGVALAKVLEFAKVPLGTDVRGTRVARYLVVSASDGFYAALSVPEVDPYFTDQQVLLAETMDGKPLPPETGAPRLVIPHDKHRRRWVNRIGQIEVRATRPSGS